MSSISGVYLIIRRVTNVLSRGFLLMFSFMDAVQPGQRWLTAFPLHYHDKMSTREDKCVLSFSSTLKACVGTGVEFCIAGASL